MSSKTIAKRRSVAFANQSGNCFYCGQLMWLDKPEQFAQTHGISRKKAAMRQCTAEHLHARRDGGLNDQPNIAAACRYCNQQRHRSAKPMAASAYRQHVERRCAKGRWPTLN